MCQGNLALVGSNQANVMDDSVQFTFCFAMDAGATWLGWQFVMDGSKYYKAKHRPERVRRQPMGCELHRRRRGSRHPRLRTGH